MIYKIRIGKSHVFGLFGAFLLATLSSCEEPGSAIALTEVIAPLATPVYLDPGKNTILLSDYFLESDVIDSVAGNEQLEMDYNAETAQLFIEPVEEMDAVTNLRVYANGGKPVDIPVFKPTAEEVTFALEDPEKQYGSVMIKGAFNGWVAERSVMQYENGIWTYTATFYPGDHQYLMVADGREMTDPGNSAIVSNGMGGQNSVLRVGDQNKKHFVFTSRLEGKNISLNSSVGDLAMKVYLDNTLLDDVVSRKSDSVFHLRLPDLQLEGRHFIRIYPYGDQGRTNDLLIPLHDGEVVTDAARLNRSDFHTMIMYFLMVDRFRDGNRANTQKVQNDTILPIANYFGGDLKGVYDVINEGYFDSLGVNTIWLSPITQNPYGAYGLWKEPYTRFSGYHGYWPISNTDIDVRFGDSAVFSNLIDAAHQKEMNVVLDYVANHVHKEHPLYRKNPEWATDLYLPDGSLNTERWDDHRLTTWFDTHLPTLDFSKPEVVEKMTDSALYWVENFELDGFRHDATKHIQESFWRTLTEKVRSRVNRPVYQIGETYGSYDLIRSYIHTGMLDAQFDFNLYDASVSAFARKDASFGPLADGLKQGLEYYGSHHLMGNITGNQDRARFLSYASGDVRFDEDAKVAGWTRDIIVSDSAAYKNLEMLHAFNLSIPGVPCIYYGDEYGVPGGNDPDNRRQMKFEGLTARQAALLEKVSELTRMRRSNMALLYGSTQVAVPEEKVLLLKRKYFNNEVIVIFNKGEKAWTGNAFGSQAEVGPMDYEIIVKN
ncbi:alpha-amylase family glycosyl hydrolase [Robertkochia aurantiaca]|uniref:alpha-amylase family glycosyl hydrolase n=1 Tax=Robertkochia aurantiaca TaxID=2873700 RepID=UPI001CCCA155|nr:alpha-amylase family glycosyl hydrolase [Robertkochia sp. 3YJGBD-33]